MLRNARHFVRAFLPIVPLAFCHGCGGGGGDEAPASGQVSAQAGAQSAPVAVNRAPTITGAITEVAHVGVTYDYQPEAIDPDGDALRFSAPNLPPWASMDPTNGRITGTPGEDDVGIHESISIVVADATHETSTGPFSITVVEESGEGVAALRWELPPSKMDGSPLDDLAGYRILYGHDSADLDQSVLITDPSVTSYEFTTLGTGIWYFAVVAVNAGGLEGPPTTVVPKSI
jgi:hypothetical protein